MDTDSQQLLIDLSIFDCLTPPLPSDAELAVMRKDYPSGVKWVEYLKANYEISPKHLKEQRRLKIVEAKQYRMENCGNSYSNVHLNPDTMLTTANRQYCHIKGCPHCDARLKKNTMTKLRDFGGEYVVIVPKGQERDFQMSLDCDYVRIPKEDGSFAFVLKQEHPDAVRLDYVGQHNLSQEIVEGARITQRITPQQSPQEDEPTEEIDLFDEVQDIEIHPVQLTITKESKCKRITDIWREVWRRMVLPDLFKHALEWVQWVVNEFQALQIAISQEWQVDILFLKKTQKTVSLKNVQWDNLYKQLNQP